MRFLRVGFLDFVPALIVGTFALSATLLKQPKIALAMAGVIPVSLGLTIWQLITQKGIRLDLLHSRERIDGTVTEQFAGSITSGRPTSTGARSSGSAGRRAQARQEQRHHVDCLSSAPARQSTKASSISWSGVRHLPARPRPAQGRKCSHVFRLVLERDGSS